MVIPQSSWRSLLETLPSEEKHRIIEQLKINEKTWRRWIHEDRFPRPKYLKRLLELLPPEVCIEFALLIYADPRFAKHADEIALPTMPREIIPFYRKQIQDALKQDSGLLRLHTVFSTTAQHLTTIFDPMQRGFGVILFLCSPLREDGFIRSVYQHYIHANKAWDARGEHCFAGSESVVGQSIIQQRIIVHQSNEDIAASTRHHEGVFQSTIGVPMIRNGHVAGAFLAFSVYPGFFVAPQISIIEEYVQTIEDAIEDDGWHDVSKIDLWQFPATKNQRPHFEEAQKRWTEQVRSLPQTTGYEIKQRLRQEMYRSLERVMAAIAASSH